MPRNRWSRRKSMMVNHPLQKRIVRSMSMLPAFALACGLCMVAVYCHRLAFEANEAGIQLRNLLPLFASVSVFLFLSGVFVLHKAHRAALRVVGPSHRLCQALRRIRGGDVGFRVHFRKGDFLEEVCDEVNHVITWLNENPPPGVITTDSRAEGYTEADDAAELAAVAAGGAGAGDAAAATPAQGHEDGPAEESQRP